MSDDKCPNLYNGNSVVHIRKEGEVVAQGNFERPMTESPSRCDATSSSSTLIGLLAVTYVLSAALCISNEQHCGEAQLDPSFKFNSQRLLIKE